MTFTLLLSFSKTLWGWIFQTSLETVNTFQSCLMVQKLKKGDSAELLFAVDVTNRLPCCWINRFHITWFVSCWQIVDCKALKTKLHDKCRETNLPLKTTWDFNYGMFLYAKSPQEKHFFQTARIPKKLNVKDLTTKQTTVSCLAQHW